MNLLLGTISICETEKQTQLWPVMFEIFAWKKHIVKAHEARLDTHRKHSYLNYLESCIHNRRTCIRTGEAQLPWKPRLCSPRSTTEILCLKMFSCHNGGRDHATVRVTAEQSPVAWPWLPVPFGYFYLSVTQQRSMLVCLQHPCLETDAAAENNKETCASNIFVRRVKNT